MQPIVIRFKLHGEEAEVFRHFLRSINIGEQAVAIEEKRPIRYLDANAVARKSLLWAMRESHRKAIAKSTESPNESL